MKNLVEKYNVPGPRYTSYPTVPFWKNNPLSVDDWATTITRNFSTFQSKDISLYIGQEDVIMPVSKKVQVRMIIASGHLDFSPDFDTITNIQRKNFDADKEVEVLRNLQTLVNFINDNKFWQAQTQ